MEFVVRFSRWVGCPVLCHTIWRGQFVEYQDKTLTCRDCSKPFTWTAGEQHFFREKELINIPARCSNCRSARKAKLGLPDRAQTEVNCAECGQRTTVPFVPRNGNPVYCSTCLTTVRRAASAQAEAAQGNVVELLQG
jgi:CxxC-x17-CxxC domain-containing protein